MKVYTSDLNGLSGAELFAKICENITEGEKIAEEIEETVFREGGWRTGDLLAEILASGHHLPNSLARLPKNQPFRSCKIAVAAENSLLLVKVGELWWQTGFTLKTSKKEPAR